VVCSHLKPSETKTLSLLSLKRQEALESMDGFDSEEEAHFIEVPHTYVLERCISNPK